MPKHLNARQRASKYAYLVKRDGEKCRLCLSPGYKHRGPNQLIIERKDNTGDYSNENIRLAHQRCNVRKNPRGLGKFNPNRPNYLTIDEVEPKLVRTYESAVNIRAQPAFRAYVIKRVMREGSVLVSDLINAGAEHADIGQQTAKRYLDRMISSEGEFALDPTATMPTVVPRPTTQDATNGERDEQMDADAIAAELKDQ